MALLRKDQLNQIINDKTMTGTSLLLLCSDTFGIEFFDWEPETFELECQAAFGGSMPQINKDKLWALVTALTTNLFYISLETFIPTCNALNDSTADFRSYDPVDSEEAAWGITEVLLNDPIEDEEDVSARFSHEIKRYIGLTLRSEGVTTPPKALKPFAEFDDDPEEAAVGALSEPDPHMIDMYSDRQAREREEIEAYINQRFDLLASQLQSLPLQQGDTSQISEYLQKVRTTAVGSAPPATAGSPSSVL